MRLDESMEEVEVIGYGKLIRQWICPFCHEPARIIDPLLGIWSCELCGALYSGGMDLHHFDPETGAEVEELRVEHEYIFGSDV